MFDVCPHRQITVDVDTQVVRGPQQTDEAAVNHAAAVKLAAGVDAELSHTTELLSCLDSAEACRTSSRKLLIQHSQIRVT